MLQPDGPHLAVQYDAEKMRFACCITKARTQKHTHVSLSVFPWPQRLRECASMLRYTHTACLLTQEL
jgi:hypothetical protein